MLGPEFSSCWLKIRRADEHAKILKNEIISWEETSPYTLSKHNDSQGHFYRLNLQLSPVPDWDRWSLLLGDVIHNLRSALDHFVYAIAINQTKANPPAEERILQFPIADTPPKFAGQQSRITSLSQTVRTAIERVQPYNREHRPLPPLLGLLRDFDDADKHRLLAIAGSRPHDSKVQIQCPTGHMLQSLTYLSAEIQNSADICAFTIEPPSLEVGYKYQGSVSVAVSHAPGPTGVRATAVRSLVDLLFNEVRTIIEMIGPLV